jgi:integrase
VVTRLRPRRRTTTVLTAARIKVERTPAAGKIKKLSDGDGLYLMLTSNGRRAWRFKFRFAGKESSLSFGPYPDVSIEVARERAVEARATLRRGENPAAVKREAREAAVTDAAMTFGRVGAEYLKLDSTKAPKTAQKHAWLFERLSKFHGRPLSSIQTLEIVTACRTLESAGKRETAHRLAAFAARVYRYATQSGYTTHNPARDLRGALKPIEVESREGITDPAKFGTLMRYVGTLPTVSVRNALTLLALTAVRPGELRAAEWAEVNIEKGEWEIPAIRTKQRRPHWVPLSTQAVTILKAQREISGDGRYVFPQERTGKRPMSPGTMNAALAVLGYKKGAWDTIDAQQPHGFRVSFSSLMNGAGADPKVIEACLAHGSPDKVAAIYNRAQYKPERRALMQAWADLIDELKEG